MNIPRGALAQSVFVDTSALYAMFDLSDQWHVNAASEFGRLVPLRTLFVTSNLVVAETHRLLLQRVGAQLAREWLPSLIAFNIVFATDLDHQLSLDLIHAQPTAARTYTDASAIAMMRRFSIQRAFSFDRHFEYAGIQRIPDLQR